MEKLGSNFTKRESGLWVPENPPSVENKEAIKQAKLVQDRREVEAKRHGLDVADIITIGRNGNTAHRPDGKFISKYELEQIQAHQNIIRDNIGERNAVQVAEAVVVADNAQAISRIWKMKLGIYNSAMKGFDFLTSGVKRSQERYEARKEGSKEQWGQKKYATAIALGCAAAFAALDLNAKVAIANKAAFATGAAFDLPDVVQDFVDNTRNSIGEIKPDGLSYNRGEDHHRDRMSTEGLFDGSERNSKEIDAHVLAKIKNNPSLAASILEVRQNGSLDNNFSLEDVNERTRQSSVSGRNGEYSDVGENNIETLEESWRNGEQGKLLSEKQVNRMLEKYDFINHGTAEGVFENARDDTTYKAGIFDYRPDLGDQIYRKELGNGHVAFFKVNEQDPSRDCLNVLTLGEKIAPQAVVTPTTSEYNPQPQAELDKPDSKLQPEDRAELIGQDSEIEETKPLQKPTEKPQTPTPPEKPSLTPKDPSKAPTGHDNGNYPAPAPTPTPDANIDGVTGGTPQNPQPQATTPRQPDSIPPVETNPSTGQSANGNNGINNGTPTQQPKPSEV